MNVLLSSFEYFARCIHVMFIIVRIIRHLGVETEFPSSPPFHIHLFQHKSLTVSRPGIPV